MSNCSSNDATKIVYDTADVQKRVLPKSKKRRKIISVTGKSLSHRKTERSYTADKKTETHEKKL